MLSVRPTATKPRAVSQQKQKGSNAQRDHPQDDHDEEEDLIEQLNRKLSNVTLNPPSAIPDEMNLSDISTMVNCESFLFFFFFFVPLNQPRSETNERAFSGTAASAVKENARVIDKLRQGERRTVRPHLHSPCRAVDAFLFLFS